MKNSRVLGALALGLGLILSLLWVLRGLSVPALARDALALSTA